MRNIIFTFFFCLGNLFATSLKPNFTLQTQAEISSLQLTKNKLYASTIHGSVEIYTLYPKPILEKIIKLPKIQDLFNNSYAPKIFHINSNENEEILIVSANHNGTRNLNLFKNKKITLLLENLNIEKALWLNSHQILIGLLSHEILLFDLEKKKIIYQRQLSQSSLSDMVLNPSKSLLFTTGESGITYAINPYNGRLLNTFDAINKDKVYQIATTDNILITGGQDRQVGIYHFGSNANLQQISSIKNNFLIYAVGIAQNGKNFAYLKNENGEIALINMQNKKEFLTLTNLNAIANTILFYNDFIIVGCDNRFIYFFNTKEKV
ncbi:WD40 repeat domain-containing protein [Helicobacter anatolicus]|uniref:hypothetical protein n=1 Tax=Helicobacter anatolicus TaxID=2905874 RepID=UPI001E56B3D2|nr:hypothetical protein [Helicobacter anatolicus]MCE3038161.1 hypothetical protein [Helicobacter anatolicus]